MDNEELAAIAQAQGVINASDMLRSQLVDRICPKDMPLDIIRYITPADMRTKYPKGHLLGSGAYGTVYDYGDYIIKSQKGHTNIIDAMKELNIYATLHHPCIMKPIEWSYNASTTYIVMPKGMDIYAALADRRITMDQIVADTLSAISFMNSNGVVHCDIKPQNIVYHRGVAKIIDMGLTKYAILGQDGKYYFNGIAYTEGFRDPQYSEIQWNPIETEIYALAKSFYHMRHPLNKYIITSFRDADLDWFYDIAKTDVRVRTPIQDVADNDNCPPQLAARIKAHRGVVMDTKVLPFDKDCGLSTAQLIYFILTECSQTRYCTARTMFSAMHLFRRCYPLIEGIDWRIIADMCIYISKSLLEPLADFTDLKWWRHGLHQEQLADTIYKIMISVNCIVAGPTYWDYASDLQDLVLLLDDIFSCDYDARYVRTLPPAGTGVKDVSAEAVFKLWNNAERSNPDYVRIASMKRVPYTTLAVDIRPTILRTEETVDNIIRVWRHIITAYNPIYRPYKLNYISVLIHNQHVLNQLADDDARKIYSYLLYYSDMTHEALDILVKRNWRGDLSARIHSLEVVQINPWA
jgi:serine/threonine protein kinase